MMVGLKYESGLAARSIFFRCGGRRENSTAFIRGSLTWYEHF
jgi:hypothetical protein